MYLSIILVCVVASSTNVASVTTGNIHPSTTTSTRTTTAATCTTGYFGSNCSSSCPSNCNGRLCNQVTGQCSSCISGYFGKTCTSACNSNCGNNQCELLTGNCICKPGLMPPDCTKECRLGDYGQNCTLRCDHCTKTNCSNIDGTCFEPCNPGWISPKCTQACAVGNYGQNCALRCQYCSGGNCDNVHGMCKGSCDAGWTGPLCDQQCATGTWGQNCAQHCGHCADGNCVSATGECMAGCKPGWKGLHCDSVCSAPFYGQDCQERCGDCLSNSSFSNDTCDPVTGNCLLCADNRLMPLCRDCVAGHWGPTCGQLCGQCGGNGTCHRTIGVCVNSLCLDGWTSPKCDQKCPEGKFGQNCSQSCGQCLGPAACRHDNGVCESGCQDDYEGVLCQKSQKDLTGPIAGSVMGAAALVSVTVMATLCFLLRRRSEPQAELPTRDYIQDVEMRQMSTTVTTQLPSSTPSRDLSPLPTETYDPVNYRKPGSRDSHYYDSHVPGTLAPPTNPLSDSIYQNVDDDQRRLRAKQENVYGNM